MHAIITVAAAMISQLTIRFVWPDEMYTQLVVVSRGWIIETIPSIMKRSDAVVHFWPSTSAITCLDITIMNIVIGIETNAIKWTSFKK